MICGLGPCIMITSSPAHHKSLAWSRILIELTKRSSTSYSPTRMTSNSRKGSATESASTISQDLMAPPMGKHLTTRSEKSYNFTKGRLTR